VSEIKRGDAKFMLMHPRIGRYIEEETIQIGNELLF